MFFGPTSVPVIGSERQGLSSCPIWPGSRLVLRPGAKIQENRVESEGANFMDPLTVGAYGLEDIRKSRATAGHAPGKISSELGK